MGPVRLAWISITRDTSELLEAPCRCGTTETHRGCPHWGSCTLEATAYSRSTLRIHRNRKKDPYPPQFSSGVSKGKLTPKYITNTLQNYHCLLGFSGGSVVKNLPTNAGHAGDARSIPGWGRSLKEEMATHSSILAEIIPWTKEPGEVQSMESQRLGHN